MVAILLQTVYMGRTCTYTNCVYMDHKCTYTNCVYMDHKCTYTNRVYMDHTCTYTNHHRDVFDPGSHHALHDEIHLDPTGASEHNWPHVVRDGEVVGTVQIRPAGASHHAVRFQAALPLVLGPDAHRLIWDVRLVGDIRRVFRKVVDRFLQQLLIGHNRTRFNILNRNVCTNTNRVYMDINARIQTGCRNRCARSHHFGVVQGVSGRIRWRYGRCFSWRYGCCFCANESRTHAHRIRAIKHVYTHVVCGQMKHVYNHESGRKRLLPAFMTLRSQHA